MSLYARAVARAVGRLPGMEEAQRADIADTLHALAAEPTRARWIELASVVWLATRLRTRDDTGDRPDEAWRQGLHRGGTLLVASSCADAGSAGAVALSVAMTWCAARGRAVLAVAAAVPTLALVVVDHGDDAVPFVLRSVVALAALVVGTASARETAALCPWRWLAVAAAAAVAGSFGPSVATAAVVVMTLVVPCLWLASSAADPRLAVGAAVALFWRLVSLDLHELTDAPAVDLLTVRWVAMVAGVVGAVVVARSSIRRLQLFR